MAIRVLICDRLPVIADGLKILLGGVPDFFVAAFDSIAEEQY